MKKSFHAVLLAFFLISLNTVYSANSDHTKKYTIAIGAVTDMPTVTIKTISASTLINGTNYNSEPYTVNPDSNTITVKDTNRYPQMIFTLTVAAYCPRTLSI